MIHGSNTRVYFNAFDATTVLHDATLSGTTGTSESTVFGLDDKTFVAGQRDRTFTSAGYVDGPGSFVLESGLHVEGGVLTYCPGGGALGDLAWMSSVIGTTYAPSDPIDGTVAFGWDAQTSGLTAFGYVLHALAEDTNTTTGAEHDDGAGNAPSATGWTAHIHAPALDGGSWVVTIQDSADGSTSWATIATFAAITVPASQRLVSAAATTQVKRHVRYIATRSSGSVGDGITFMLGFSRTQAP